MTETPSTESTRVEEIEAEFPAWSVWVSDTGNWWASLRGALTLDQIAAGCSPFVRSEDADELLCDLADREALMAEAARP